MSNSVVLSVAKDLTPATDSVSMVDAWTRREVLRYAQDDKTIGTRLLDIDN